MQICVNKHCKPSCKPKYYMRKKYAEGGIVILIPICACFDFKETVLNGNAYNIRK